MAIEQPGWLDRAMEIYRAGRVVLEKWRTIRPHDVELDYCIEELKDELLELKEATLAQEIARAIEGANQVAFLILEIRQRSEGIE